MKALKLFSTHNHKHLFLLNLAIKTPKSFSLYYRQNLVSPSHFHSTNLRFCTEDSSFTAVGSLNDETISIGSGHGTENSLGIWSVYNSVTGETLSRPCMNKTGGRELDPSWRSSDAGVDDFERTRKSGGVKEANASNRGNSNADISDACNWFDNFEGGGTYGKVRRENSTDGYDAQGGSSSSDDGLKDFSNEKSYKGVKKANLSSGSWHEFRLDGIVKNKKKVKEKVTWVCTECGHSDGQWWGSCRECNSVGTVKQFTEASESGANGKVRGIEFSANVVRSWLPQRAVDVLPLRLTDVNRGINQLEWRIPLSGCFGYEVARVLGGGLVPGSLVLIGGDPGVGKSTLLLQMAAIIAEGSDLRRPAPVLYVSGEESVEQIGNRADRMSIRTEELFLYSSTDIEDILKKVHLISPRALVIDSIQTVYLKGVTGSAGGILQVKECTLALLCFAKKTNIPVLLVGHVTKSGEIAGPRVLEHIVDVVLYMEGEENSCHRLLRPVKNRFGSTDELGVFEMSQLGLRGVSNPSEIFLSENYSDSEFLAGLAVAVIMDGSRSFLLEIQALCVSGSTVSRHVNGILASRADMIISVLMKQASLKLQENAVFLNVVSGVSLTETAGDLAIAAAICSSFLEFPIPNGVAFIGEIGLGGELRMVPRMEKRVSTVAKLGYKKCIIPKSAEKSLAIMNFDDLEIIGCKNLKEVINVVFRSP